MDVWEGPWQTVVHLVYPRNIWATRLEELGWYFPEFRAGFQRKQSKKERKKKSLGEAKYQY